MQISPTGTDLVRVVLEAGSDMVEPMHAFLLPYAQQRFRPLVRDRVALASSELVANALDFGSVAAPVVYLLRLEGRKLSVSVSNDTIPTRMKMLADHVDRINDDPEGTYMSELERSIAGSLLRPHLGLVRLRHEANMELSMAIDNQRVTVTAACDS